MIDKKLWKPDWTGRRKSKVVTHNLSSKGCAKVLIAQFGRFAFLLDIREKTENLYFKFLISLCYGIFAI